ncbi:hypothetical protein AB4144_46840 [Rhizobiaceae sp. 2RAB30]
MPRYFFDTVVGRDVMVDDFGLEFFSRDQMRAAALHALPELARELLPNSSSRRTSVKVRDELDRTVFAATLTLTIEEDS